MAATKKIRVVGAGRAGLEAALQAAVFGCAVPLHKMRPPPSEANCAASAASNHTATICDRKVSA